MEKKEDNKTVKLDINTILEKELEQYKREPNIKIGFSSEDPFDDLPLYRMDLFMLYLTQGTKFEFAQLPANDKTAYLLNELKDGGFISKDTKLAHFRVIFGIPLHIRDTPFEPIKWRKNRQLLRYFIYSIFPRETILGAGFFAVWDFFADKHGDRIFRVDSDKKRLNQSADYDTLYKLLNKFNECGSKYEQIE